MRTLAPLMVLALFGCSLPMRVSLAREATPTRTSTPPATDVPATPTAPLGSSQNPLVLALSPSTQPGADVLSAGQVLTSLLEKNTGYSFASVIPPSEANLIAAFGAGNAHLATLSPFGYLLVSEAGSAEAAFAREQDGAIFYSAEFIAPAGPQTLSYFDAVAQANLAESSVALLQFENKKPCWTDARSPSGYVVPLGFLRQAGVTTREPAFLASHIAVVRAVYAGGICDFGGTYADARLYPGLEDELPESTEKLIVVWRTPSLIPYETMVLSRRLPVEMRRLLTRTLVDLMATPEGKQAVQTLYGINAMQVVTDGHYEAFRAVVRASGLHLADLLGP